MIAALAAAALFLGATESQLDDPCLDALYVSLKAKGIDALSDREFEIFQQKDDACNRYRLLRSTGAAPEPAPSATATPFPTQPAPVATPIATPPPPVAPPVATPPPVPTPTHAFKPPVIETTEPLPAPPSFVLQGSASMVWGANDVDRRGLLLGAASLGVGLLDRPERGRWANYFGGGADVTWGGSHEPGRHTWSAGIGTRMGIARFGSIARIPDTTLAIRTTPFVASMEDGPVGGVRVAGSIAMPGWPAWWARRRPCGFTFTPLALPTSYLELGVESYGPQFDERVSFFFARLGAGF